MSLGRVVLILILLWVFVYTCSYGIWTWKKENRFGAVMVFLLAAAALVLPVYSLFFRE
jgi:predicted membrane channel-forming protein YqfA (hemolysin III family)